MDRHACRPLVAAGQIVRYPRHVSREGGVDTTHCDEYPCVDDAWDAAMCGGRNADYEADQDGAHACEDIRGALTRAVRKPGYGDCKDGGGDVDGDCEELCGGGCVAEFADDAREEEGGAVERADDAPVHWISSFVSAASSAGMGTAGHKLHRAR